MITRTIKIIYDSNGILKYLGTTHRCECVCAASLSSPGLETIFVLAQEDLEPFLVAWLPVAS